MLITKDDIGKEVKLRNGDTDRIISFHPESPYPVEAQQHVYTENGRHTGTTSHPLDIIEVFETLNYTPDPTLVKLNSLQAQVVELSNKILEMQATIPNTSTEVREEVELPWVKTLKQIQELHLGSFIDWTGSLVSPEGGLIMNPSATKCTGKPRPPGGLKNWPKKYFCEELFPVKKVKRSYWVNLYRDSENSSSSYLWSSKELASEHALLGRIACIKIEVDCEEGEGL